MKKYLFLVASLLLILSMTVTAQNSSNRRGANDRRSGQRSEQMTKVTPQKRAELMTKELDLTAEEAAKVLALCEKQEKERLEQVKEQRSQRGTGAVDRDARREEFRKLREKQMKEQYENLAKIIGKEKADKWNNLLKDQRDNNRAGRRNPQNSDK